MRVEIRMREKESIIYSDGIEKLQQKLGVKGRKKFK